MTSLVLQFCFRQIVLKWNKVKPRLKNYYILGLVQPVDPTEDTTDGKPYSVLIYSNGPGYSEPRKDLTNEDLRKFYPFNFFYIRVFQLNYTIGIK